jgi:hypothetical protein
MFIEPQLGRSNRPDKTGWIEVICGCMFSGKTEELIRRLNRALIAKQKVEIFKPTLDTRYHDQKIVSHSEREIRSTPVDFANDIILLAGTCDVVGIDEAQFFDDSIIEVCNAPWPIVASELLLPAWIWTTKVSLLARCLIYWPWQNMLQRCMPSVHKPENSLLTRFG